MAVLGQSKKCNLNVKFHSSHFDQSVSQPIVKVTEESLKSHCNCGTCVLQQSLRGIGSIYNLYQVVKHQPHIWLHLST